MNQQTLDVEVVKAIESVSLFPSCGEKDRQLGGFLQLEIFFLGLC
jgi:hypothetical protein